VAILIGEWESVASHLISRFLAGIEGDVAVVRITKLCSDATAGMRQVIQAIGFEPKDMSLADLENVLTNFLSDQRNNNRRTIICFEETQDSGWWVLDRVRCLVDLETEEKFGLMVILSGRPSLNELLIKPPFDTICAHAGQRIALAPFTLVETKEYISREIALAGIADTGQVFEYHAITLIHELCAGVPDTVDTLCGECIQLAYEEDTAPVTMDLVKKVDKLLRLTSMIQQSDAGAGPVEGNGASPARGRLIAHMNGMVVPGASSQQGTYSDRS
jgi:type II secretory pathway predicted ATPase ExeA